MDAVTTAVIRNMITDDGVVRRPIKGYNRRNDVIYNEVSWRCIKAQATASIVWYRVIMWGLEKKGRVQGIKQSIIANNCVIWRFADLDSRPVTTDIIVCDGIVCPGSYERDASSIRVIWDIVTDDMIIAALAASKVDAE